MPEGEVVQKDCLYWYTDRTPYEWLLLKERTEIQYFRLVTSEVSIWCQDHWTVNPLGVAPNPDKTKIV